MPDPLMLSLDTFIAVAPMLGHKLEDRSRVRNGQVLYAEALKRGLESRGGPARVLTMAQLAEDAGAIRNDQPTVVLGYIKEFLNELGLGGDGRLTLFGRPVTAAVNDRFCLN